MTLDNAARLEKFDTFERVLGQKMEHIFEQSMLGEVTWDHDTWSAFLDWIQGPLRRRMYKGWLAQNPGHRIEEHPAYTAFESFDRARLQGLLEDSHLVRVCFSAVAEMVDLERQGLQYFGVRFTPPPSGLSLKLEERGA